MKKRILLLLVAMIGMATSAGWAQSGSANIKTDLKVAQKGKPIVFSVTTQKGSDDKTVRVELKMNDGADLSGWKMEYYEAQQQPVGWKDWTPEGGVYMYGPSNGFPLINGTSYFRMTPAESGEYTYSLSVKEATGSAVVATANFKLAVKDQAVTPIASISEENYASLATAVTFAKKDATINLSEGNFLLDRMLIIDKPLSVIATDPKKTTIQPTEPGTWVIPEGMIESESKHLITIVGNATGNVTLENLTVAEAPASGINAQSAMKTILKNVYLPANKNAGLLVHSTVEATGLHTQQNVWGGVNVDQSSKTSYIVSFKFDETSTFSEPLKIWSEITENEKIVTAPKGWTSFLGKGGSENTTDMRFWNNSKLEMEFCAEFPTKPAFKNMYFIYANGQPVTVSPSTKDGYVKVSVDNTDDFLEIPESNNPVIFGGSKYADVESSHITMTGGKVFMIFGGGYLGNVKKANVAVTGGRIEGYFVGGGYGPKAKFNESKKTADVTGKVTATISNAYIRYLVSGGMEYARTEATDITVTGENTEILYGLGGGFAPVGIGQSLETSYDAIANRTNNANFSMTNGKVTGCFYIGGGYSYSYTKEIITNFNGVTVEGGMKGGGSNGCSDNVRATFTKCNFSKGTNAYTPSIAAVNRGKTGTVSMTFNNCTFTNEVKCYLGADSEWQDGSFPVPVSENAIFAFTGNAPEVCLSEGMQNVTLAGAQAKANVFIQKTKEKTEIKEFTIPAGKTWAFNQGLTIAEGCTLTNNGTLSVPKEDVMTAITAVKGTIKINATAAEVITQMNKAGDKKDLDGTNFTIECSDAAIASNAVLAKELLKAGKNTMLLKFESSSYSINTYTKKLAKITNLPDSVVYGTKPITLTFNITGAKAAIKGSDDGVVSLEGSTLTILKPGTVTFDLTVDNNNDATNTQTLKVTKKMLTVSGITAKERTYDGTTDIELVTTAMNVQGLVAEKNATDVLSTTTGVLSSPNAGDAVPVIVTATLKSEKEAYYELANITGVTAKINKVALTVTATKPEAIDFGKPIPTFEATPSGFVNNETVEVLGGTLQFDCPATTTSLTGEYPVMPFGYTSQNYAIEYTPANLKINAIKPTVEITGVKVNSVGAGASITVSGRVLLNGGTKTSELLAKFEAKTGQTTKTVDGIKVKADGTFTADITELTSAAYTVDLTVSDKDNKLTSTTVTSESIALNAKLQNIRFATELSRLVYGSKAAIQAEGYAEGATVKFTTSNEDVLAFNEDKTEIIAKKAGSATITVTATLDQYVTAVAKQTITVEPKTLTVTSTVAPKSYDGTNTADVTYKVNGLVNNDVVTVEKVDATFANVNCGADKRITLSKPLTLSGKDASNYQLIQPSELKGTISKAGNLTVKATNVSRKYNDPINALKYTLEVEGFVNNETLATALRTGAIIVKEEPIGSYTVDVSKVSFPNYGKITGVGGKVDIIKGTPKVITVNTTETEGVDGVLVEAAGWGNLEVKTQEVEGSKHYAYVTYDGNQIARGEELEAKQATLPNINWEDASQKTNKLLSKAAAEVAGKVLTYGDTQTISGTTGYTVESSDPTILTVSGSDGTRTVTAVGTGNAALIFTKDGAVSSLIVQVNPKPVSLTVTGANKTYDGTTTANVALSVTDLTNAALNLGDITFDYESKDAGENIAIYPSKTILLQGENANKYQLETASLKGKISASTLKVTSAVSKYYDGTNKVILNNYSAEGLAAGEEIPLTATFASTGVGTGITITWAALKGNYTLNNSSTNTGSIIKSTLEATLPTSASSESDVKDKITYMIRETGAAITADVAKTISSRVTVTKTGSNSFLVSGGDTENYSIVYSSNTIGFKSEPSDPGTGTDPEPEPETVAVSSVSLDKSELTLPRLGTYTLKATVNPSDATNKKVSWKSSDEKIATVDADGKVTAVAVGKATITVTTEDGNKTATCAVTVDLATGIEELIANTRIYGRDHVIYVEPAMPVNVLVVNTNGMMVYNDLISSATQIPVSSTGIYIVKIVTGSKTFTRKVSVR
ncbi:YDG domain-containing protein [Parabacteroides chongii]|uniref:YDG domain-containing protein n=1 Tax=Parabacteroides chongii TaxID=2685834 RepID=UPI00240E2D01|nr:YDG domain-containing protein [Parabacteroides chongii]WFE86086.1 YDG domain-containing protein [Parabacteroides chongii]